MFQTCSLLTSENISKTSHAKAEDELQKLVSAMKLRLESLTSEPDMYPDNRQKKLQSLLVQVENLESLIKQSS